MNEIIDLKQIPNKKIFVDLEKNNYTIDQKIKMIGVKKEDIIDKTEWYFIDGDWYYFKGMNEIYYLINELLGVKLAKLINLPTVEYKLAHINIGFDIYGIMSKSWIEKDKEYLTLSQLSSNKSWRMEPNIPKFKKIVKDNYNEIIKQLFLLNLLDFYMSQIDRVSPNMVFEKDKDKYRLNKVFDYTATFNTLWRSKQFPYFPTCAEQFNYFYKSNIDSDMYICSNSLISLVYPSVQLAEIYKNNKELVNSMIKLYNFNIIENIKEIENMIDCNVPNSLKMHYESECDTKKKIMEKVLKSI